MTTVPLSTARITRHYSRDAWREARRRSIGASDAAAIWGASGWNSPYSVWWSKVGPMEADEPDVIQRVGHAMEPLIAEMFTEATGVAVYDPGDFTIYTNSELDCMACTPDRLTADGMAVVELKTASFSSATIGRRISLSDPDAVAASNDLLRSRAGVHRRADYSTSSRARNVLHESSQRHC